MEHDHSLKLNVNLGKAFKIGITINILYIIVEAVYGFSANSMALVSDAGHNLSDLLALVFSWIAVILSRRKATLKFTYGFRGSTMLTALLNTFLLLVAVAFLIWETVQRLGKPVEINSNSVIIVAFVGIFINGLTAWLFSNGKKHDLNIRSAFVHFFADALVSLGVVVAGIVIAFTGITWIDSVVSFIIIFVILYSTYKLLIDSVKLALDAVPENVNIEEVRSYLKSLTGVSDIHDLHIWAIGTADSALTVHLVTQKQTDIEFISDIQHNLHERFNIEHATIQVEYGKHGECIVKY